MDRARARRTATLDSEIVATAAFAGAKGGAVEVAEALLRQLERRARTTGQLFYSSDGNRDDRLSFKEFQRGVAMMGVRPMPSKRTLRAIFKRFDTNHDGTVSYSELKQAVESQRQLPAKTKAQQQQQQLPQQHRTRAR